MLRKIIRIDEEKCNGCGLCIPNCHEGAIKIVDGKAKLISDAHCDGLGACLGHCPQDALTVEERDTDAFDEEVVQRDLAKKEKIKEPLACGCPGTAMRKLKAEKIEKPEDLESQLSHWPVQLRLVPPAAPFLQGSDLLICADCVPFAVPDFHSRYLAGRAVLVGCPKLDDLEHYREKLKAVFLEARPSRVTVLRMEVPCCGGLAQAAMEARDRVIPETPLEIHTVGVQGGILRQEIGKK
ncbi:MAG TPA: 4Fe-4S ferredoxin [Cyanobacteria bacterium UBA8530]|nr:4Fe-4S ferredoxin [Cyanobacteria bacterium UBA8530]